MTRVISCVLAIIVMTLAAQSFANEFHSGNIRIMDPWARATNGDVTAVYLTIMNTGTEPDRLLRATTDVGETMIHETKSEGGINKMRMVDSLPIPAKKEVSLKPGSLHIMVMGLKQPLTAGSAVPITLVFEKAGEIHIDAMVQKAGAQQMNMKNMKNMKP